MGKRRQAKKTKQKRKAKRRKNPTAPVPIRYLKT
jgi:hypothetical protein